MERQSAEQHRALEHFEKSNALFFEVFTTSPASNAILDLDEKRFIAVNDGFLHLFGYERGEVIGRTVDELQIEVDDRDREVLYRQLRGGERVRWREGRVRTKTGEVRDVIGSYSLVKVERTAYAVYKLVDITSIRRLEKEVLEANDQVQRRIAQDLHDGLGGSFTQVSLKSQLLAAKLKKKGELEAAADAARIAEMVREAVEQSRRLVHGLLPEVLLERGLPSALGELAGRTSETVACRFESEGGAVVEDPTLATHLYRMAQEAVHNALKHSKADRIVIRLTCDDDATQLEVTDDGIGIPEEQLEGGEAFLEGAGLRSIRYRARLIGATAEFKQRAGGGSIVRCTLPHNVPEVHCETSTAEAA